jgi:hypothetical protein
LARAFVVCAGDAALHHGGARPQLQMVATPLPKRWALPAAGLAGG